MAYISRREQYDLDHMTLPAAVTYICRAENWDEAKAKENLINAIAEKAVHVTYKNNDQELLKYFPTEAHEELRRALPINDKPRLGGAFIKQSETIDWNSGTILDEGFFNDDNFPDRPTSLPRVLLLLRQDIEKRWSAAGKKRAAKKSSEANVKKTYLKRMEDMQNRAEIPSRKADDEWAISKGFQTTVVRNMRKLYAPTTWTHRGRRASPKTDKKTDKRN